MLINSDRLRKLIFSAVFVAVDIICTRFFSWMLPSGMDRISLQFVPNAISGAMMGPVWSAAICAVGDILGMLINSAGKPYLPLFTISAAVRGIVYGLTLHGKKPSIVRSVIAVGIVTLIVDLGMNSLWLAQMISSDWLAVFLIKLPTRLITIPVYALVLFAVWKGMESAKLTEGK